MLDVAVRRKTGNFDLDASFSTGSGVTALFGRSGAGKSTIVAMVAGLVRPDSGRIRLSDRLLFCSDEAIDVPIRKRRIAVVFQEPRLFPHLSVRRNLTYGQWAGGRDASQHFDAIVDLLGLSDFLSRRPDGLSGGEAQRVSIGRALLADPDILLMDEPLSQLDGSRRSEILPFLDGLAHEAGVPILYVSHALDEVARLANFMVVLSDGKVVADGPIDDVLRRIDLGPATGRYEAGSLLHGTIAEQDPDFSLSRICIGGAFVEVPTIPGVVGDAVRLRIRARDVALALEPASGLSIRNSLAGTIREITSEDGPFAEILMTLDASGDGDTFLRARLTRKSVSEMGLEFGSPVYALIKAVAVDRQAGR